MPKIRRGRWQPADVARGVRRHRGNRGEGQGAGRGSGGGRRELWL